MNLELLKAALDPLGYEIIGNPHQVDIGDDEESCWVVHCMRGGLIALAMCSTHMAEIHWGVYDLNTGGRLQ